MFRKILVPVLGIAAVVGGVLAASPASAADALATKTVLSVNGFASSFSLTLADNQYPSDKSVTLNAVVTLEKNGKNVTSLGKVFFTRDGSTLSSSRAKMTACSNTFIAHFRDGAPVEITSKRWALADSNSQAVTVTLTGGHCATQPSPTTPVPSPTTSSPSPSPSATKTVIVTPGETTTKVVQVPVPVIVKVDQPVGTANFTG